MNFRQCTPDKTTLRVIRRLGGGKGDVSVCGGATSHWQVLRKAMPSCCTLDAGRFLESPCPPLELDAQRELEGVITLRKMATAWAAVAVAIQVVVVAVVVVVVIVVVVVVVAALVTVAALVVVNLQVVVVTVLLVIV